MLSACAPRPASCSRRPDESPRRVLESGFAVNFGVAQREKHGEVDRRPAVILKRRGERLRPERSESPKPGAQSMRRGAPSTARASSSATRDVAPEAVRSARRPVPRTSTSGAGELAKAQARLRRIIVLQVVVHRDDGLVPRRANPAQQRLAGRRCARDRSWRAPPAAPPPRSRSTATASSRLPGGDEERLRTARPFAERRVEPVSSREEADARGVCRRADGPRSSDSGQQLEGVRARLRFADDVRKPPARAPQ